MNIVKKTPILVLVISIWLVGCSHQIVSTPPPASVVEVIPGPPSPSYVWIPGHYVVHGGAYIWRNGYYSATPRNRKVWTPGRYVQTPRGYVYRKGRWRR